MRADHRADAPVAPRVLSIAGTDPTGGAGIQADLKSIAANGGYGMAVITALVAQNTVGVREIHAPPVEFLVSQLAAVSDDVEIDAVKIGMLFDSPIIGSVSDWLSDARPPVVVLDPVMVATSGDRLLTPSAEAALRELVHRADLVTPNIPELAVLLDEPVAGSWEEALHQAHELSATHRVSVLLKGGHLDGPESPDALISASENITTEFTVPRVPTRHVHGTGCSFSAAVATLRPQRADWESTIRQAKSWLTESIAAAGELRVGKGNGPVSHFSGLWRRGGLRSLTADEVATDWWSAIGDIRAAIDDLRFVRGLAEGSLDETAFTWYLAQDARYLRDYSRVLAEASKRAPTPTEQAFWASSANAAIATELDLHARWLPADRVFDARASGTTTEYVNHLLATAVRGSYDELVAAVLPCFWIYADLGSRLRQHATPTNPYAAWLTTYGDPDFEEANRQAVHIVTTRAAQAAADVRDRMKTAFCTSAHHELRFFAAPLDREEPVSAPHDAARAPTRPVPSPAARPVQPQIGQHRDQARRRPA